MNAQTRKSPVLLFVLSLVILSLVTSACSFLSLPAGEFTQDVEVTLDEQLFADAQPTFKVHDHDFWEDLDVQVDRMQLHDGYIRFLGTRRQPNGSRVDCTIDVSLMVEDGLLISRIIALDIPGMKLTDPVVVRINQEFDVNLSLDGFDRNASLLFQEVDLTEDALRVKLQVRVNF